VWVDIINSRYVISDNLKFSGKELTAAISRNKMYKSTSIETTTMGNKLGLYKAWIKKFDKYLKNTTLVAYYCTTPNTLPMLPGGNSKWYDDLVSVLPSHNTHSTGGKQSLPMEQGSMPITTSAPTQKKRRGEVIIRNAGTGQFSSTNNPVLARSTNTNGQRISDPEEETPQTVQANPIPSWWESTNAFSLFVELKIDDTEDDALDLKAMVKQCIERLRRGHTTAEGWKLETYH
jgi:hypothetical protein